MPTTTDLRDGVDGIRAVAIAQLDPLFVAGLSAYELRALLNELLPGLLDEYGSAAASWGADWYDDYRLERDVPGRFTARVPALREPGVRELVAWATEPLQLDIPDPRRTRVLLNGGIELRISNATRDAVTTASFADPQSEGWQRVGAGACPFCAMLIGRGRVYRSERTARFASHDNCHCSAAPAFGGLPLPVTPYEPSSRRVSDTDRARVRAFLRANPDA